jgi:Predicted acyltransferases
MNYKKNNFDFLRLIFASFVIVTHSYPLSGIRESDFLYQISNGQVSFSDIGVKGFFVISGFLIFQSLQRSDNILEYYWKRFLRLFPALFIVLLLTVILVPFVYKSSTPIFQNKSLLTYIPRNLILYRTQLAITGVFETNRYKSVINGSLWTISYEFTMYIILSVLILFKNKKIITKSILFVFFIFLLILNIFFFEKFKEYGYLLNYGKLLDLSVFFIAGALLAAVDIEKMKRKKELLILISILVIASIYYCFYNYLKYLSIPIFILVLGLTPFSFIHNIGNKIGDLSYGIYIYGFPVQQTLMYYFRLNYLELMIYSMVVSCFFAYFSWHFIEKNALKLKKIHPKRVFYLFK